MPSASTLARESVEARRWCPSIVRRYLRGASRIGIAVVANRSPDDEKPYGRYRPPLKLARTLHDNDRMVPSEISMAIRNHIADSGAVLLNNCGRWPPFEK